MIKSVREDAFTGMSGEHPLLGRAAVIRHHHEAYSVNSVNSVNTSVIAL